MIRSKLIPLLAVGLAVFYGLVSVAAIACVPAHADDLGHAHYQTNALAHSLFCSFACQVAQAVVLASSAPEGVRLALAGLCLFTTIALSALVPQGIRPARAPPR